MKKIAILLGLCPIYFCLPVIASEEIQYVDSYAITLDFDFGTRNGVYSGGLKDSVPNGIGKFVSTNESGAAWTYVGEWSDGHFNGTGMTIFDSGNLNAGTYSSDYLNGNGLLLMENESVYTGNLIQGVCSGTGKIVSLQDRYTGEFSENKKSGTGTFFFENGNRFEGTFSNDYINGAGTYYLPSGEYIVGTFYTDEVTDLVTGNGTLYALDGTSMPCQIVNGQFTTVSGKDTEIGVGTDVNESNENLKNASIFKADVMNGLGTEVTGQRAYVIIPKDAMRAVSESEFTEFVQTNIKDHGYNWFTITFDDGTGINFAGSFSEFATYGKIDVEGCITEPIGYITLTENGYVYE